MSRHQLIGPWIYLVFDIQVDVASLRASTNTAGSNGFAIWGPMGQSGRLLFLHPSGWDEEGLSSEW